MTDKTITIDQLKTIFTKFIEERDWRQFHTPKNLSMAISAEAAELMELFLWSNPEQSISTLEKKRTEVEHELADITLYIMSFCAHYNIDLSAAIERKMALNAQKYPVEKARGNALKYSEF